MQPSPTERVVAWLDDKETDSLFLTAVTVAEVRYGLEILPHGARQRRLQESFENLLDGGFLFRILDFDLPATTYYGNLMASRRRAGRPMSMADGQIAAIALSYSAELATRNGRDFQGCGLQLHNPFED